MQLDPETRTFSRDITAEKEDRRENNDEEIHEKTESGASKPGRKSDIKKKCQAFKMKAEGKKQHEIAKELGVSLGTVSKWLNGPKPICDEDDLLKEVLKERKEGQ